MRAIINTSKGSQVGRSDSEDIHISVYIPEGFIGLEVWKTKYGETRAAITVNDDSTMCGSNTMCNYSINELLAADFLGTGNNGEEN